MAAINDLVEQIQDEGLKTRIQNELEKMNKQRKFGLVFENHLPECTPLYDVPVKRGSLVAVKNEDIRTLYYVVNVENDIAHCIKKGTFEQCDFEVSNLLSVAEFGQAIYPYLKPIGTVSNTDENDIWHTLIEADNYHALQLLEYLYAGKVDCIYIDPPYNTGARDWKYNNDYVDGADEYRHSKWLSFMERRLKLAKKLLNPRDSVLIVTIDEKEYLHLGCLLEQIFSEAQIQMVSITISPSGAKRDNLFSRVDEYAFIILFGNAHVFHPVGDGNEQEIRWFYLRRTDFASRRGTTKGGVAQFYPIYVDNQTKRIVSVGDHLTPDMDRHNIPEIKGATAVFPIREDGVEMNWGVTKKALEKLIDQGFVQVTEGYPLQPFIFKYVSTKYEKMFKEKRWAIVGERQDGSKIIVETGGKITRATTVWQNKYHDAGAYGTSLLKAIIGDGRFNFPKSLFAERDTINYFVKEKPNALILDFFAGSGTTLHAVNLLNAEDGGHRRCIIVTNNEVSDAEAKELTSKGYQPGDEEWEKLGIARYVTWPRTVCSIEGHDVNGNPLKGNYISDKELPMADGFKANCAYYKLGFLDKTKVALGMQFKQMLPTLWMKAGCFGRCPEYSEDKDMLILPENKMAILIKEKAYCLFEKEVKKHPEIETIYIVTDSDQGYREMISCFQDKNTFQLYKDYLDNFRINVGRD